MKKKVLALVCIFALLASFAACGKPKDDGFEWTRTGTFTNGDSNYVMIYPSPDESTPGWSVGMSVNGENYGWIIPQEGHTLKGNVVPPYEENTKEYIVTVEEEGEKDVKLTLPDGTQMVFKYYETPDWKYHLHIGVDGVGSIAYAEEGEELVFDEYPYQDTHVNLLDVTGVMMGARPGEGYKFVKWTKDGEDFSTEDQILVTVDADVEYIAVFAAE